MARILSTSLAVLLSEAFVFLDENRRFNFFLVSGGNGLHFVCSLTSKIRHFPVTKSSDANHSNAQKWDWHRFEAFTD